MGERPDYQARVIEERAELDARLTKLEAFLETEASRALPAADHEMLFRQRVAMDEYRAILDARIERFGES